MNSSSWVLSTGKGFSCFRHTWWRRQILLTSVAVIGLVWAAACSGQDGVRNSTRKIRVQPSAFAAQCGSAVKWRDSLDAATQESQRTGKPVFWYVPTIDGSFMDRRTEIDRYMMSGPFSWPPIVEMLNDHTIPVRAVARDGWQEKYKLNVYEFVEPGWVILSSEGAVQASTDQVTTFHYEWIEALICRQMGWIPHGTVPRGKLDEAWQAFRTGADAYDDWDEQSEPGLRAETILLQGMFAFRRGDHAGAKTIWETAKTECPEHPLAWKAAAEAEGWGPFCRGFEIHTPLSDRALMAGSESRGSAAPADTWGEQALRERSCDFLLSMQHADGGWFDSDYDFGGTDSLPNVHVAVTALCGLALLDIRNHVDDERQARIDSAVRRAFEFVSDRSHINYVDKDEILWAHAYRIRFLARLVQTESPVDQASAAASLQVAVADLEAIQTRTGSYHHEYANPFVTATALTALYQASQAGAVVDEAKTKAATRALSNDRYANGAFPYYGNGTPHDPNEAAGTGKIPESAGRMPLCELALWRWGSSSDERLQAALRASLENHRFLAAGYKYDNHTSTMSYGGFFFWYDMRARAEALAALTDPELKRQLATEHKQLVLALPELDGCFVDSHELGRCYGTAMAMQTLAALNRILK